MKFAISTLLVVVCALQLTLAAPAQPANKDLSSLLNLLPHGGSSSNNLNLLGLLSGLTNGTSINNVVQLLQLLQNIHQLEGDLSSIPTDILHALNQTAGLISGSLGNLTSSLTGNAGKRDLSSLLNLLPHGGSSSNNLNLLGLLSGLTNGTSINNVVQLLQLLQNIHQLEGDLSSIPTDILHALNQTAGLISGSLGNLTSSLTGNAGKRDLSSLLNLLPHGGSSSNNLNLLGLLSGLTNGTSINNVVQLLQLLQNIHQLEGDLSSIPTDILHALNQTAGLISGSLGNLTSSLTGNAGKRDLSSLLNLLPHGGSSSNNLNLLGLLSGLTNGTSINNVVQLLQLLQNIHQLEGDLSSIPTDILHALNQTAGLISGSLGNLTSSLTGNAGKRDLSSLLNLLPHGNSQNSNNNALGLLGQLTQGTNINSAIQILQLLQNLHQLEGDLSSIPTDILHALNQTAGLIGNSLNNVAGSLGGNKPTKLTF